MTSSTSLRIVGIDPAVRIAHVLEDCFTAAKEDSAVLSAGASVAGVVPSVCAQATAPPPRPTSAVVPSAPPIIRVRSFEVIDRHLLVPSVAFTLGHHRDHPD